MQFAANKAIHNGHIKSVKKLGGIRVVGEFPDGLNRQKFIRIAVKLSITENVQCFCLDLAQFSEKLITAYCWKWNCDWCLGLPLIDILLSAQASFAYVVFFKVAMWKELLRGFGEVNIHAEEHRLVVVCTFQESAARSEYDCAFCKELCY
eukprot:1139521-Pelagomonas_calceolata.AAC.2